MISSLLLTNCLTTYPGPGGNITIDANEYSVGTHKLTVTATDSDGNSAAEVFTFTTAAGMIMVLLCKSAVVINLFLFLTVLCM